MKSMLIVFIGCLAMINTMAQQILSLEQMNDQALQNNKSVHAAMLDVAFQKQRKRFATDIGQANVLYMRGQINSYIETDYNLSISQNIPFPLALSAQYALSREQVKGSEYQMMIAKNNLTYQVKHAFFSLMYSKAKEALLKAEDSIYDDFINVAELRYRTGRSRLLEKATAEAEQNEVQNRLAQTQGQIVGNRRLLQTLLNSDTDILTKEKELAERKLTINSNEIALSNNPGLVHLRQQIEIAEQERKVASANLLPGLNIGYFSQTLIGSPMSDLGGYATAGDRFRGFQIGLNIPIWFGPQLAKVKAAEINIQYNKARHDYSEDMLEGECERAVQTYRVRKNSLDYYQSSALKNAEMVLRESQAAYSNGEIEYHEYWLSIQHVMKIRENYLSALNDVNQSVIYLEYLSGVLP